MEPERCQAIAKSGKPCGATVVADGMCAWHAPSWADRRRQWSAKGGAARSNAARAKRQLPSGLMTTEELRGVVGATITQVLEGKVEPGVANSVAALSRAYVAVTEAGAVERLEERLAELERLAAGGRSA